MILRTHLLFAMLLLTAPLPGQLAVYISADMEGVAGVVTGEQLGPGGFEYARFRQFMTDEVLAAIAGAREAGADRILVADSHGNGQNLLIEQLPKDIRIVRSWPRPLMMMEGIDRSFDAAIFIGYHASTSNAAGVRAHTFSSANLAAVRLNGIDMSEASFNAAVAGHFGVPVVMISGDDVIVAEARKLLGPIAGAVVKSAISFHAATTLTPQAATEVIKQQVIAGLAKRKELKPYRLRGKITLEVTFKNYRPAQLAAYLKGVEQIDSHTIRYIGADMVEIASFVEFLLKYEAGLQP